MSLLFRHYAHEPLGEVHDREQEETRPMKPDGLWLSVDGNGDGWRDWCEAEDFQTGWKHVYEVTLAPGANVLAIDTAPALFDFTRRFQTSGRPYPYRPGDSLRWREVAELWDGIVIAPYQWECRLHPGTFWYYGWDCASACIWKARAIAEVVEITADVLARSPEQLAP